MVEYSCNDINGNPINEFVFQEDGVVYGVVNYDGSNTNYGTTIPYSGDGDLVNISSECCSGMGFSFNSSEGKCFYREVCDINTQVKIVFGVNENSGLVFNQETNENCRLNLQFDYLVQYDTSKIYALIQEGNNVSNILKGLNLSILIEKTVDKVIIPGVYYENTKTYETVFEQPIYGLTDFSVDTGVILDGLMVDIVNNNLQNELGNQYNTTILDSSWLSANVNINNLNVISQILDSEVKFSLLVTNSNVDFSIIMDNIRLDKICDVEYTERKVIDKSPSFNMVKTVDNKKSWVNTQGVREYDLPIRETYYETDSEKMVLNSKEIELSTSIVNAIEEDIISFMKDNPEILDGDGTGDVIWGANLRDLMSSDVNTLKSAILIINALNTELIDVKSRKTLNGYPVLNLIHERYLDSEGSNQYDYTKLSGFINMLGDYWVDLIEQVIPATTIWGSTNRIGSNIFRTNKFVYNKYNLQYSYEIGPNAIASSTEVEVIAKEITQTNPISENRFNVFINSFSNSCEMLGKVSVSGDNTIIQTT